MPLGDDESADELDAEPVDDCDESAPPMSESACPVELSVEAYTDDRSFRFSRHGSAVELTRAIAVSVAQVLVDESGIAPPRIGVCPFGNDRPIDSNATAAGRARNRRVEIVAKERP